MQVQKGDSILDLGCGCCWTVSYHETALQLRGTTHGIARMLKMRRLPQQRCVAADLQTGKRNFICRICQSRDSGICISACLFTEPQPEPDDTYLFDFALLFSSV